MFYLSFGSNQQDLPSLKKQSPTKFKTFAMLFLSKKKIQPSFLSFTKFHQFLNRFLPNFTNIQRRAKRGDFFSPSFTPQNQVSNKFYQVFPSLPSFNQVLPPDKCARSAPKNFTKFYQVLPSFTKFYQVSPSFTKFHQVLPSFTKFYQVLPSLFGKTW